ncbi:hypothetical protein DVH05_003496 [Phytophthora capsici]|nr:hypothetical protein DVH05_003496 [Phytophthora capsici]
MPEENVKDLDMTLEHADKAMFTAKRLVLQDIAYSEIIKLTSRIEVLHGYTTGAYQKIFEDLSTGVKVSYQEEYRVFEAQDPVQTHLLTREPLMRDSVNGRYIELFNNKIMWVEAGPSGLV